jgi:hypothetical protein
MKFLNKLPNSVREPPGLEWVILKKLPMILAAGTLLPLFISMANRFFPPEGATALVAKHIRTVDILCISTTLAVWTAAFTVAIGCFVVWVMKGPTYVADSYEVVDSETPRRPRR